MSESADWMSKAGPLVWLGGLALAMFVISGLIWWWMRPEPRHAVILFGSCFFGVVVAAVLLFNMHARTQAWESAKRDGLRGTAKVLQVESTNVIVQKRAQVRMRLNVSIPGKPRYEVVHLDTVALGQGVMPGRELTVYVDRQDPQRLVIDWNAPMQTAPAQAAPVPASPTVAARLEELGRLRAAGQITEEEYQAHRQRLLTEL